MNPTHARERFREALDLIVKAWTHAGAVPVELEALLLPLRQPLAAAVAAAASADLDSRRRQPGDHRVRRPAPLRLHGHSVLPHRRLSPRVRPVPRGLREGRLHRPTRSRWAGACRSTSPRPTARPARSSSRTFWYFVRNLLKDISLAPPGYTSPRSALAIMKNRGIFLYEQKTWDDIEKGVFAIVGSPETVRQKLEPVPQGAGRRRRADRLPDRHACRTTWPARAWNCLAREVLPHVRDPQEAEVRRPRAALA